MFVTAHRKPGTVIWIALLCLAGLPAQAQTIHFHFSPPDGRRSIEVSKRNRVMTVGDSTRTEVMETKALAKVKKHSDGYTITSAFLSASTELNGQPFSNPFLDAMKGQEITYLTDPEGRLREIQGFEKLLEVVRSKFPPAVAQAMAPLLNRDTLVSREKAEWEGRVGQFAGRSAKIGEVWTGEEDTPLPTGGTAHSYSAIRFDSLVEQKGKQCVRLKLYYNTDATALGKLVGKIVQDTTKAVSREAPVVTLSSGIQVEGEGERIVDPDTMTIYSENITRTIRMTAEVPGHGPTPMTLRETREYSFEDAGQ